MSKARAILWAAFAALYLALPSAAPTGVAMSCGPAAAQAQNAHVSINVFFSELQPYGTWVHHQQYNYVWVPNITDANWSPYQSGHWVYVQGRGWYFESDDPFGWVVYHYG